MKQKKIIAAMCLYDFSWRLCIPLLRLNARLKDGFENRRSGAHLKAADVWLQAASAGEAYLALSLIDHINADPPVHVIITTNTRQGLDILKKGIAALSDNRPLTAECGYIPLDRPSLMDSAVQRIGPKLMILLETEIWPGLLFALKKNNITTLIINGRLTPKSLQRYMLWPSLWESLSPDKILAISGNDAERFGILYGDDKVRTMSNIKFDRLQTRANNSNNPLGMLIPNSVDFLVLGSVREPEESQVENIIRKIQSDVPETIIGLFPRHMHRIKHWEIALDRLNLKWVRRSELTSEPVVEGTVILWDTFGELNAAYATAKAVFVGGSLAPLGGQNFLEPMIYGITPIIGPSWENFSWVGNGIFNQGLVIKADTWQSVASGLIGQIQKPQASDRQKKKAISYIEARKGGTRQACKLIERLLNHRLDK